MIKEKNANDQEMADEDYMEQILKQFNSDYKEAVKPPKAFRKIRKKCVVGLKNVLNEFHEETGSHEFNVYIDVVDKGEERTVDLPVAIASLQEVLREDEGYYISWKANIAMAFYDACLAAKGDSANSIDPEESVEIHTIANNAAENFLNNLIKQ